MQSSDTTFLEDYSIPKNTRKTVTSNQSYIRVHIVPHLGTMKARDVTRADIAS